MTKKDKNQKQDKEQKELFKEIKNKFTKEPILKIYRLELPTRVKIDLLNFILGACMVQKYKDKIQHLIAYYSQKLIPPELNYNIYNKELLAIVTVLKEWRAFLQGIIEPFIIKTDYKNLIRFLTTKELNRRQVKWVKMLAEYYFKIKYVKGTDNVRVNTLSRKAEL